MLNEITSRPGVEFASNMACRKEPAPVSFVFDTVKFWALIELRLIKSITNTQQVFSLLVKFIFLYSNSFFIIKSLIHLCK